MCKFIILFAVSAYAGIFSASVMQAQAATKIKGSDVPINGDSFFACPVRLQRIVVRDEIGMPGQMAFYR